MVGGHDVSFFFVVAIPQFGPFSLPKRTVGFFRAYIHHSFVYNLTLFFGFTFPFFVNLITYLHHFAFRISIHLWHTQSVLTFQLYIQYNSHKHRASKQKPATFCLVTVSGKYLIQYCSPLQTSLL